MSINRHNERTLGEVIKEFLNSASWREKIDEVNVRRAWHELMGPSINRYTRNIRFRKGTLTLQVDSSPLKQELSYSTDQIIKRINEHIGKEVVEEVKVY